MNIDYNLNFLITFNAGLTYAIKQEIKQCNVSRISEHIAKHGIENDFKNNNLIVWCSLKCIQLIQEMNRKFHLELGLPKGIFVEDFSQLRSINENSYGFTNINKLRGTKINFIFKIIKKLLSYFKEFRMPSIRNSFTYKTLSKKSSNS